MMILRTEYIVPPKYPELNRVMTIVLRPVMGPNVAMKAVRTVPMAPKHIMVAMACLRGTSVCGILRGTKGAYGRVKVKSCCARTPIETVVITVFTDLEAVNTVEVNPNIREIRTTT